MTAPVIVPVALGARSYNIHVGPGLIERAREVGLAKLAVTERPELIVSAQLPVPEHAPAHPWKVLPCPALALRVTRAPAS